MLDISLFLHALFYVFCTLTCITAQKHFWWVSSAQKQHLYGFFTCFQCYFCTYWLICSSISCMLPNTLVSFSSFISNRTTSATCKQKQNNAWYNVCNGGYGSALFTQMGWMNHRRILHSFCLFVCFYFYTFRFTQQHRRFVSFYLAAKVCFFCFVFSFFFFFAAPSSTLTSQTFCPSHVTYPNMPTPSHIKGQYYTQCRRSTWGNMRSRYQ